MTSENFKIGFLRVIKRFTGNQKSMLVTENKKKMKFSIFFSKFSYFLKNDFPGSVILFWKMGFRGNVHSAKCTFWQVSILENVHSGKCLFGQMYMLESVRSGKYFSGKCTFREMFFWRCKDTVSKQQLYLNSLKIELFL